MLAGMVQAPSRLAPTQHLAAAQKRSRLVLAAMADTGAISRARAASAIPARPVGQASKVPTGTYFADWVAPYASQAFDADFGEVRVRTTLDRDLQRLAIRAVSRAAVGDAQVALVAMRPDGRVVAMVGGRSYKDSPFNRATQARRQPGSAFKLFVYLAALRAGWTPDSMIEDEPITIDGWTPVNSDRVYRGEISLREAFARSSNAATVRLSQKIGRDNVIRAARDLGISTPLPDKPSLALGTAGVSLLELTSAYAAVAGGRYPIVARGLADEQQREGLSELFRAPRPARFGPRPRADARPALCGGEQRHRPPRRACRPDLRQDRHQPGQSRRLVRRLCRRPGGRRVGRARRQQIARQDRAAAPSRRRSGAISWFRRLRSTIAPARRCRPNSICPSASPAAPAKARCPRTGATAPGTCATSPI